MAGTYVIFCSLRVRTRALRTYGAVEISEYSSWVVGGTGVEVRRSDTRTARTQGLYLTKADGDSNMTWSGSRPPGGWMGKKRECE